MKTYTFEEAKERYLGKRGTEKREKYEFELNLELIGEAIKTTRKERNLTQEQLGKLVGVQKAQISKIENNFTDARFKTILKVFKALNAKINFNIELLRHNSYDAIQQTSEQVKLFAVNEKGVEYDTPKESDKLD